jgi:hypothetical protein
VCATAAFAVSIFPVDTHDNHYQKEIIMRSRRSRVLLTSVATVLALLVVGATPAEAAAPEVHADPTARSVTSLPAHRQGSDWLLAADDVADRVFVVSASTGRVTGELEDVRLGTHAGVVQLGAGRVAFMDESKPRLDVVAIGAAGRPRIVARYVIPQEAGDWERAGWLATDPSRRYLAVGSDFDGSTTQQVTVIDRRTHRSGTSEIPVSRVNVTGGVSTEEVETFLVGSPVRLVVTAGGRLDAYRLGAVLAGRKHPRAIASTPLSAYPHGPVVNATGTVIGSDVALGVQTTRVNRHGFGTARFATYPRPSVQSYRPVMAPDGVTAVGTQAGQTATGTAWNATPAYLTSASTASGKVRTVRIGTGQFTRVAATRRYAVAEVTGAHGDRVVLVHRNPRTGLYDGTRTSHAIPALADEPVPGQSGTGAVRFLTATPDGTHVFVTRGGEGTITELTVRDGHVRVARTIHVPGSLSDGGYLTTVVPSQAPYDLSGR